MVLADVEETTTTVELDEETFEEIYKVYNIIIHYRLYSPSTVNQTHNPDVICERRWSYPDFTPSKS